MKPGWRTTEFWLTLAASITPFVGAPIAADRASILATLAVSAYSIARGIAKRR